MRFPLVLLVTFSLAFSAAAWPNTLFGQWPALLTAGLLAWLLSPWLGGRQPLVRWFDSGLLFSLLTALLALAAVHSLRGLVLGLVSAAVLLVTVAARLMWSVRVRRVLPTTTADLLSHLLAEPPEADTRTVPQAGAKRR